MLITGAGISWLFAGLLFDWRVNRAVAKGYSFNPDKVYRLFGRLRVYQQVWVDPPAKKA